MEILTEDLVNQVVQASNSFERNNSDLKRRYFVHNIEAFNYLASLVSVNRGSFGTGYPFYALGRNLQGKLPVIGEQIRYNEELENQAKHVTSIWTCGRCLSKNYIMMNDLKGACKPCPNMRDELKPRKIINRLPDVDMWLICEDGRLNVAEKELGCLLTLYGITTSDVDPLKTIQDMTEISQNINDGVMPKKFLPIDAHIMEYSKLKKLILQVPETLQDASENKIIPYLPIQPKSYRKTWQYDDEAYNFIYDFLSAFTEFNFTKEMNRILTEVRYDVVSKYDVIQLYEFLLKSANEANRRRNLTESLSDIFNNRIKDWKERGKLLADKKIPEADER